MPARRGSRRIGAGWDAGAVHRITRHRYWGLHVGFAVTMVLVTLIAATDWSPWPTRWPAFAAIGALSICYATFGRRGYDDRRAAGPFLVVMVIAAFVLPAIAPSTAFVQSILYPVLWCQLESVRGSIAASALIGIASGAGLTVASGPDSVVGTILIEGVSVAGACALGLWITRIATLSDERRQLIDELRTTQDSLAEAHRRAGVTSERERLARELHDTVAQNLAGIVMLTERARGDLAAGRTDRLDERLSVLEDSARAALEESRTLVAAGAAGVAGDGLGAALHRLGERFARETGVPITVDAEDCVLDRDAQVVLLRVAQEALANVRAHAGAASVRVALRVAADRVGLRITDDGVGFDPTIPTAGYGLRGLRERLALAGGTCTITTAPGHGTVVAVELPDASEVPDTGTPVRPVDAQQAGTTEIAGRVR